jgi:hypothetical protein
MSISHSDTCLWLRTQNTHGLGLGALEDSLHGLSVTFAGNFSAEGQAREVFQ